MIILNVSKKNNENKRLNQQEDVECEDAELTINTPMFIPSSSRYDSNTSVESSAIINIPNQTRNRKQDTFSNSFWKWILIILSTSICFYKIINIYWSNQQYSAHNLPLNMFYLNLLFF